MGSSLIFMSIIDSLEFSIINKPEKKYGTKKFQFIII